MTDTSTPCAKPPLGLVPRSIRDMERCREILVALSRYNEAGKPVPQEWLSELFERLEKDGDQMTDTVTNPENVTESAGHSDIITATASPRPWRVAEYDPGPHDIYNADGIRVCTMGLATSSNADAALIVEAVNNYGRELAALHIAETHIRTVQMERDRLRKKWVQSARKLVESEAKLYNETKRRVAAEAERDRLRDIVRRIETELDRCHRRDGAISQELIDAIYEASEAIGEDRP